jgi:hypothetical protein
MPALKQLPECSPANDDQPLQQGDLFEWRAQSSDPYKKYGIIVTADCDLAQRKHFGVVSYVPILTLRDYWRLHVLPTRLDRILPPVLGQLTKIMRVAQQKLTAYPTPLSEAVVEEWIRSELTERIASVLEINNANIRKRLEQLAEGYVEGLNSKETGDFHEQFDAIVSLRVSLGTNESKATDALREELTSNVESLPGDAFFLGALEDTDAKGFVAYLRFIRELDQSQVAIRFSDLQHPSVLARRTHRLRSPYMYRLTQQLGDVFSSIGLPEEYEAARRSITEDYLAK